MGVPTASNHPLRILHLEDNELDGELIRGTLQQEWPECIIHRVDTREDFVTGITEGNFDLVLSDFSLPLFDGLSALDITRRHNTVVPFIFLSGSIGEDYAVSALQKGATDYVLKDRQVRLIPAIKRAIEESHVKQQRRLAEAQFLESQDRFLKLAEQSSDVFWFVQPEPEQIQYVSPAFEQVWGLKTEKLYENPRAWEEAIHPADRPRVEMAYEACLRGRVMKFEEEYRILRPDGSERWVLDSGIPIRDTEHRVVRISGIAKDITERKIAEQHIREQAELIDKAREAIYLRDLDDKIFYWNKAAERIFGYSKDEVFGRKITDLKFQGGNLEKFYEAKDILLREGEWTGEFHIINRSGQELDLQASWALVCDDQGAAKSILCIDIDVTEQRALEKQFFRTQRQESMGTLAGGIAHDLNNVLAPILMSVELLQSKPLDPDTRRLIGVLETSAQHGAGLVRQVLAFSRGTDGERTDIQPKHVIQEVIKLLSETLPRSITLETALPDDLHTVPSNSTELGQVLMNLCVNARDAMPDGGRILIKASNAHLEPDRVHVYPWARPGPCVLISVADNGSGIPAEIIDRIFDPFFTTKKLSKGTGLGLSTVLGIIKSHHGILQVHSKPRIGTEFQIFLPAATTSKRSKAEVTNAAPALRGQNETILIIDDEEPVRTVARAILETYGYTVIEAEDGRVGLALFEKEHAHITAVFTDMMMPAMQGPEVIRSLRKIDPDVGIVAMSGMLNESPDVHEDAGRLTLLKKPMTANQLLQALQRVLPSRTTGSKDS